MEERFTFDRVADVYGAGRPSYPDRTIKLRSLRLLRSCWPMSQIASRLMATVSR